MAHITRFPATPEGLGELHVALDLLLANAVDAGHPVAGHDSVAMRTAAAEIAANIVEHACVGMTNAQVRLTIARAADRLELVFEDPGLPFEADPPQKDLMPQGGIGLAVALASVDVLNYTRVDGTNQWRLVRHSAPR